MSATASPSNVWPLHGIDTSSETSFATGDKTKRTKGGRPRKYASAAERQAAHRARNDGIVTWRLAEVPAKISELARECDIPANELAYQMLKFALSNHDWRAKPIFGKLLPNAAVKAKLGKRDAL